MADHNVEVPWLRQERLKNMIIKYLSASKNSKSFNQHIAHSFLFQMRYDSLLDPEKWPSDGQKCSANPSFWPSHSVLLSCLLPNHPFSNFVFSGQAQPIFLKFTLVFPNTLNLMTPTHFVQKQLI